MTKAHFLKFDIFEDLAFWFFFTQKSKNGPQKNSIHVWEIVFLPKSPNMDHKKIVYTSGKCFFYPKVQKWVTQKNMHFWEMGFLPKSPKMDHKKIVYTSRQHVQKIFFTHLSIFPPYPIIAFHPIIAFFTYFLQGNA